MAIEYKPARVRVGSLQLDSKNSRIPADRRSDDQRHLLHQLLEHEDVKGLASSISKLGLFPNERLVVIASGRRYVVLEGNRRLAAIKLLVSPELAPSDSSVRYFRRLAAKTDLSALGKVDVAVVKSRVSAAAIIAALHIGESKRRWSSLQQARFYRELIDEGQALEEIAEEVGATLGQVRSYLRAEKLHRLALTLEYGSEIKSKIEDSRFPLTTLERFLESKVGRKFLGIELDEERGFLGTVHPDRFTAVLKRVATDVVSVKAFTRKIHDEAGFKKYIAEADKKIEKTKMRGRFVPEALLGEHTEEVGEDRPATTKKRRPKPRKDPPSIVPRGFHCSSDNDRVRAVFNELKSLRAAEQRNSTGVMLRVLLDIALWRFFEAEGHAIAVRDHYDPRRKKRKLNRDWTPPLRDLISFACERRLFPGMAADGYRAVRTLASKDAGYFITIDGFNAFTHNPYVTPTEGDLRALWQRAEPMLEVILN